MKDSKETSNHNYKTMCKSNHGYELANSEEFPSGTGTYLRHQTCILTAILALFILTLFLNITWFSLWIFAVWKVKNEMTPIVLDLQGILSTISSIFNPVDFHNFMSVVEIDLHNISISLDQLTRVF